MTISERPPQQRRAPVTVLIPTFNRAMYLAECLDSVLGQTMPPEQIIVVNDGSTDGTAEVVKPYLGRIEYFEKSNGGKSSALNTGMRRVRGTYVWIMDDDDVAIPDALARHVELLETRTEVGFAYGSRVTARSDLHTGRIQPEAEVDLPEVAENELFIKMMEDCFISHPAVVVRKSCYEAVGPFDETLTRSQDYEMALRLCRRFRGASVGRPVFFNRIHEGTRGSESDQFQSSHVMHRWRQADRTIFRRLRRELALHEYLPRSDSSRKLDAAEERRAYLQRMVIMATKALREEMLADLRLALGCRKAGSSLTPAERHLLARLGNHPVAVAEFVLNPEALGVTNRLASPAVAQQVRDAVVRGLYWHARWAFSARNGRALRLASKALWRVLDRRTLVSAVREKLHGSGAQ